MDPSDSREATFIIGVGASAGGLEALIQLLEAYKAPLGAAIVVVQHLAPNHRSLMVDLLTNHTKMRVCPATDGLIPAEDTVYVNQPQEYVRLQGNRLQVEQSSGHVTQPIDALFSSLATHFKARCTAIVLSGTGRDGADGIQQVKEVGGLTIVQRPDTARFDGMPQAALATGSVDLMLTPGEMLAEVKASQTIPEPLFASDPEASMAVLGSIFAALRTHTGVDFSHYKPGTIARRVERRLGQAETADLQSYAETLKHDHEEALALQQDLLIGVTAFMRDEKAITALQDIAIPRLLTIGTESTLRAWVAGCSTGEEAYSIAMLLDEALRRSGSHRELKVFATDIDEHALERASLGRFSTESVRAIPVELREHYLKKDGQGFVVTKELREKLLFSRHNVVTDPPFPRIHLVSCRNLLIYLKTHVQQRVLNVLSDALVADGLLWLGASEALGPLSEHFEVLDQRWKLFAAKPDRPRRQQLRPPAPIRANDPLLRPARPESSTELAETLLRGFLPPTLVVDEYMQLAYRYGDLAGLMQPSQGKATLDLRDLLPQQVSALASIGCQRVRAEGREFIFRGLVAELSPGVNRRFDLRARPLNTNGKKYIALMFDRLEECEDPHEEELELGSEVQQRVNTLERELKDSRASLQSTVEELESSNEELQATNEELVASNEELQSTNEELQSVNEELHTVNSEHTQRLEELVQITHDLDQLLSSLDIGILFVDSQLNIRRFNIRANCYVNVLLQDIGRPLHHLTHQLDYTDLLEDCRKVLQTGSPLDKIVPWTKGRVRVQVHPFSAKSTQPSGLVISITDVIAEDQAT